MKRRVGGRVHKPRICGFCGFPLAEQRPVYLVTTPDSRIVGPLHAGCAERCRLASAEIRARGLDPFIEYGRIIHAAKVEDLEP